MDLMMPVTALHLAWFRGAPDGREKKLEQVLDKKWNTFHYWRDLGHVASLG
jgi:hypothetical protein